MSMQRGTTEPAGAPASSRTPPGGSETARRRGPDQRVTGEEPMTSAQAAYLKALSEEAGEPFDADLTKAAGAKRIDELHRKMGLGQPWAEAPVRYGRCEPSSSETNELYSHEDATPEDGTD